MKKIFILLLSAWNFTLLSLANVSRLPERTVENVADGVIVTYKFENPIIRPNHLAPGSYLWEYMGFGVNDTPGEPAIPYRSDMFYIPAGYKAQITLLDSTYRDTTIVLSPAIPAVSNNGSTIVSIDSITPYTGFLPNNVLKYGSFSNYRGAGLQCVTTIPIKYNYNQNIVRAYTGIKYKVTFVRNNVRGELKNEGNLSDLTSTFLSNITLNYAAHINTLRSASDSTWHSVRDEPKYLIITTNEYYSAIQDFVEWKRMKGKNVEVEKLPKGLWNPTNIKFAVELHDDPLNRLEYLLIIGGKDDVPGSIFPLLTSEGTHQAVTDFYYGLPNSDSIPQIHRGRIIGDSLPEIIPILNKIIQYEKNPTMNENFYKTGLHCSAYIDRNSNFDIEDGKEDRGFILTSENIRNHVIDQGLTVHRQYSKIASLTPFHWSVLYSDGGIMPTELQAGSTVWNGNADSIQSIINSGTLYVLYNGHGETNYWCNPLIEASSFSQLQNGDRLPVVFSIACHTGNYRTEFDCLAKAFLKNASGGCAGIIAPTSAAFSGWSDALVLGMFDAIWQNLQLTYVQDYLPNTTSVPVYELGQLLDIGLLRMYATYNYGGRIKDTYKVFHYFGDPSMRMYTEKPHFFTEPSIFSRNDSIFVFVEDGDCKITFYDKETTMMRSYKGNYAGYANPSDSLVICLDRHNYVPFIWEYTKDIYIQNEDIKNETRVYKGNNIYVGKNVTTSKPIGDVNIQNAHVTIQGKRLELRPGTRIDKNFKFENR